MLKKIQLKKKKRANIQYAIICSEEDIDKKENEKTIILIWNTSTYSMFRASSIYLNAFPVWYYQQKEKGHTFCIRIDSMGWYCVNIKKK